MLIYDNIYMCMYVIANYYIKVPECASVVS